MQAPAVQRSIQQKRAHFALSLVDKVTGESDGKSNSVPKCFKSYANSLPAMIQMNGIGQALAFAWQKSRGKQEDESTAWRLLFEGVRDWLLKERKIWGQGNSDSLFEALTGGSQYQYQLAQAEAQALLFWVKEFARARITGESEVD